MAQCNFLALLGLNKVEIESLKDKTVCLDNADAFKELKSMKIYLHLVHKKYTLNIMLRMFFQFKEKNV